MAWNSAKHRVLVVGAGSIGERHIRCFLATRRCDVSFVEINETLRQTIAARYSTCGFATLEEGIAIRPDIAVIATPAHLHVEMATRLLNFKVPVTQIHAQTIRSRGFTADHMSVYDLSPAAKKGIWDRADQLIERALKS